MKDLSRIFDNKPEQWGLRGDPYMWEDLQKDFQGKNIEDFDWHSVVVAVFQKFEEKAKKPLTLDTQAYVEEYAHGGMSSGSISGDFWISRGIPILFDNYHKLKSRCKTDELLNADETDISKENAMTSSIRIQKIGITKLTTDVIVNAANEGLWAGGGVCGAIFKEAGYEELTEACNSIGSCEKGNAVITPGFKLPVKYIIHAVGPVWHDGNQNEPKLLYSAYKQSLIVAKENGCHSIGFPLISAGIFGYPKDKAWRKAIQACKDFIKSNPDYPMEIIFAVLDDEIMELGMRTIAELSE